MTGRDLIVYILENHLEDAPVVDGNGVFIGFMSEEEAAVKFDVGVETIKAWYVLGKLNGVKIGDRLYFLNNVSDPRKDDGK